MPVLLKHISTTPYHDFKDFDLIVIHCIQVNKGEENSVVPCLLRHYAS